MWSDRETHQDCLGYRSYVEVLSNVCTHSDLAPLTLGIFGPWGSGKTSLMRMLMKQVEKPRSKKKQTTLWFNAWMYEGRDEAQSALIHAILASLQKNVSLGNEVSQLIDKLKKGASILKLSKFIMKSAITMTPDIGSFAQCFKEESANVADTMESFEHDFECLLKLVGVDRIIVFIDDLDRCSSAKVIETFETIKLFLHTPACAFVIGADPERIQQAVGEIYNVKDIKRQKDYLEKIVQIPFSIPAQDIRDIGCYVGMLIVGRHISEGKWEKLTDDRPSFYGAQRTLTETFVRWVRSNNVAPGPVADDIVEELQSVLPHVHTLARGLRGNPRQIKRFLNILSLRKQLVVANKLQGVQPDLLVKFAVLEYVWSEFFNSVAETVDPQSGFSELLVEIAKAAGGTLSSEQSPTLTAFLGEPGLAEFVTSEPTLGGAVKLEPYLFLAQTSLSRGSPAGVATVDEKTKQLVRSIEGSDTLISRAAARRAASQEPAVASSVLRLLVSSLSTAREPIEIVNIVGGLGEICATHSELFKMAVKPVSELDGDHNAVSLAVLTFFQRAREKGNEISAQMEERFSKAQSIASALNKSRATLARRGDAP